MRKNLPVTQREYLLRDGMTIVSRTDLKGRIEYVNADFLEAAGFEEAELLDQPHNLVRHPDMPEQAFEDMWRTLKAGRPWTGLVKNRRKNGDHYWVVANATPLLENGSAVGYMSVRTRPTREQVQAAEAAYRLFIEGRAQGLAISEGHVVKTSGLGRINPMARAGLTAKFSLLAVAAAGVAAAAAAAGALASLPLAAAAAVLALATGVAGAATVRPVVASLRSAAGQLDAFSQGRFDGVVDARGHDERALMLLALKRVQTRVGFEFTDAKRRAIEMQQQHEAETEVATEVRDIVAAATRGDLSKRLDLQGKNPFFTGLCGGLNELVDTISSTIREVRLAADQLGSASAQVSQTSQSLSHGASQQAASVEETTASLQEMASSVKGNAENATVTDGIAAKAAREAADGGAAVAQTVAAMKSIAAKVRIIDDIAYQTNLLALNAAIEGRARGRSRQGFLRWWPPKCASWPSAARWRRKKSAASPSPAWGWQKKAGGLLSEMVPSIQKTGALVQGIAASSADQSDGVGQITSAMKQPEQFGAADRQRQRRVVGHCRGAVRTGCGAAGSDGLLQPGWGAPSARARQAALGAGAPCRRRTQGPPRRHAVARCKRSRLRTGLTATPLWPARCSTIPDT